MQHKTRTTARTPQVIRRSGPNASDRHAARVAHWPVFAQKYTPLTKEQSRSVFAVSERTYRAKNFIAMGAPSSITEVDALRLQAFVGWHQHTHHLLENHPDKAPKDLRSVAFTLIQQHGFPRWLVSSTHPNTIICGVGALVRRLRLEPSASVLSEIHAMLEAEIPTAAELQAAQVCHAGR